MMGRLCFLIALCSLLEFYKRVFWAFVGFLLMDCLSSLKALLNKNGDFGCGFLIVGCFAKLWDVLVVFFMCFLGLKALQFSGHCKFRKGFSSVCSNGDEFDGGKKLSFNSGTTRVSRVTGNKTDNDCGGDQKFEETDDVLCSNWGFQRERRDSLVGYDKEGEENKECCNEDQVFDVMLLRKMVKAERQRANAAFCELEKERMAAASAADEAMAMILRLQNEKSSLQMQVNQLQRLSEEKHLYDQDLIHSLQWIILKHESERSLLEDQLRLCREKLRMYVKGEEWDQFDSVCPTPSATYSASSGSKFDDLLLNALDLDSSPM